MWCASPGMHGVCLWQTQPEISPPPPRSPQEPGITPHPSRPASTCCRLASQPARGASNAWVTTGAAPEPFPKCRMRRRTTILQSSRCQHHELLACDRSYRPSVYAVAPEYCAGPCLNVHHRITCVLLQRTEAGHRAVSRNALANPRTHQYMCVCMYLNE